MNRKRMHVENPLQLGIQWADWPGKTSWFYDAETDTENEARFEWAFA